MHGARMLPRSEMLAIRLVQKDNKMGGGEGRFTAVQEMKQHTGGISFVSKVVEGLTSHAPEVPIILVDLLAHEGWPSVYGITEFAKGDLARNVVHT